MENKLINDFEVYLRNHLRGNQQELAVISVTHMEDDDITLLLMDKNDGIGGHFVVFPLRSHHRDGGYFAPPEYFAPPKYDIGEFAEFMDWCFKQGWRVRLDLSEIYLLREERWINRFTIEERESGDRYDWPTVFRLGELVQITGLQMRIPNKGQGMDIGCI